MSTHARPLRLLTALLAALLLATIPSALAEGEYRAVVSAASLSVYAQAAPHDYLGALPQGTVVTVKAVSGAAALISCDGKTGIAPVADLSRADGNAVEAELNRAMVTNRETRVYTQASASSAYSSVPSGAAVTLLAVNGDCARVRVDGAVGYMVYSHLSEPATAKADTPTQTGSLAVVTNQSARITANADGSGSAVTLEKGAKLTLLAVKGDVAMVSRDGAIGFTALASLEKDGGHAATVKTAANPFASGSNEHAIYAFLTGEMGYNRAAAMGVVANIKYESSYNPDCNGDGGTSYGICQWHAGRKTNLINYCDENGLDYTTLEGQLKFLKYELSTRYPSVHSYMKGVENSAEGAYDAAYYFCFNFEAPAARTSQSTKRATYARDTLFGMY